MSSRPKIGLLMSVTIEKGDMPSCYCSQLLQDNWDTTMSAVTVTRQVFQQRRSASEGTGTKFVE